jgi:Protein of unknown function (DUF3306)
MSEGFLRRWASKKAEATQPEVAAPVCEIAVPAEARVLDVPMPANLEPAHVEAQPAPPALPSLEDAKLLTNRSDFIPFMRDGVSPAARNTALKTLFTDPQFNVMDMMDVYVDDYSKPDPIPEALLRMLNQSIDLGLFAQTPEPEAQAQAQIKLEDSAQDVEPEPNLPMSDQA